MAKIGWIISFFAAMYLIATALGFTMYLLLSPNAMWVSVFTLMPIISAELIYVYLKKMNFNRESTLRESFRLSVIWIALSFGFDALTYIVIVPEVGHTAANWTFFRDQSPWIWLSYLVLLASAWAGRWVYLRRLDA